MILDFHTHVFPDAVAPKVIDKLSESGNLHPFTDASYHGLQESMKAAGITCSINQPVQTRPEQVEKVNRSLVAGGEKMAELGILSFGGIHPAHGDIRGELRFLKENGVKGIKLHPAFQQADLDSPDMMRIIAEASELDLIVLTHAGWDQTAPDHNYASVPMVLRVLKEIRPGKMVLAHMGGWGDWDTVRKDLAGAPVWFDTAFSLGKVIPKDTNKPLLFEDKLNDEDFISLVRLHGAEKILFATDSPWDDQTEYVRHMEALSLTAEEKQKILWGNGASLLDWDLSSSPVRCG